MRYLKTLLYRKNCISRAKKQLGGFGIGLKVNAPCIFNKNVYIGDYCNFNGMQILGGGKVTIGNFFHSGVECMMITQNNNYEGNEIPYDSTYICKNVTIGDCVWFGNRVMVVGIESIINQTYKTLEVFLVNDGSTNNALEVCKNYENENIHTFHQEN